MRRGGFQPGSSGGFATVLTRPLAGFYLDLSYGKLSGKLGFYTPLTSIPAS